MINISIGIDGVPSEQRVILGNQYENIDEKIVFDLPQEYSEYNKYIIGVNKQTTGESTTIILPFANDTFVVSSSITHLAGNWLLYVMLRQQEIDLDVETPDISAKNGEHVFIANGFIGVINKTQFNKETVENAPLDENLQVIYDELLTLKGELERALAGLDNNITIKVAAEVERIRPGVIDEVVSTVRPMIADGKSAYELAVENGFEGTEEEWLESLKYQHSEEFEQLANQVRQDAQTSTNAVQTTTQNKNDIEKLSSDFNTNYNEKLGLFNDNATQKTNEFDANVVSKTDGFNQNVTDKTNEFNQLVEQSNNAIDQKVAEATNQADRATQEANRAEQATDSKLDKNLGIESANKLLGTDEAGNIIVKDEIKQTAENVSYGESSNVDAALDDIYVKLGDLMYVPISITSFTNNKNTQEMGSTIIDVVLNWNYNKTPKSLTLDSEPLDVSLKTKTLSGQSIKTNKTFTLKATDERDAVATKTTAITFLNGVYYGVGDSLEISGITNEFILGLTKTLQANKSKTFTVNAGVGKHIYYIIPTRYGTPVFKVGGFEGGFGKLGTINFTNASGYAEDYDVYKSGNANLGSTTVVVS